MSAWSSGVSPRQMRGIPGICLCLSPSTGVAGVHVTAGFTRVLGFNWNPCASTASAYLTLSHFPSLCLISSRKIPGEEEQPGEFGSGIIAELLKDLVPLGSAGLFPEREFVEMSPGKRESALFNGFSPCILVNFCWDCVENWNQGKEVWGGGSVGCFFLCCLGTVHWEEQPFFQKTAPSQPCG